MFSSMLSLLGSLRGGSSFITNSLRFRSSASAFLSRTPSVPGSQTTWTWSGWIKRGGLTGSSGAIYGIFGAGTDNSANRTLFWFDSGDKLVYQQGNTSLRTTTAVFRDTSAWGHLVVTVDNSNPTATNRILMYWNGVLLATTGTGDPGSTQMNLLGVSMKIGTRTNPPTAEFFDGYLTEVHFVDGQALTPASFGAINSSTGVWAPRPYSGTYGANGFYLKFADASAATAAAIGKDSSGNGNNWTPSGISVTAGATYDSMIDVPVNYSDGGNGRGNYAVGNPLYNDTAAAGTTWSGGNLNYSIANAGSGDTTFSVSSGKWYWEHTIGATSNALGVHQTGAVGRFVNSILYGFDGNKIVSGTTTAYGATYTTNDIIGVAVDADAGTVVFYKNNVSQGSLNLSTANITLITPFIAGGGGVANVGSINFGQRPFQFPVPAGFRALNTNNLPTPSIVNGANFMAATTYTGTGNVQSIPNTVNSVSFQPDLVWIKNRTAGTFHALFDSARGATRYLSSNTTALEALNANTLTAFTANGFSLGNDMTLVNSGTGGANSYVAWQWKESVASGLDVVTYTGTGVARTVAHNLGKKPSLIICKGRDTLVPWECYHSSLGATKYILLNSTTQAVTDIVSWNNTEPTSSVFTVGTSSGTNKLNENIVAYCFAEIAGFSRFGSYTGNGLADGPFVFCGFRPRWILYKNADSAQNWVIWDTTRTPSNAVGQYVFPNTAATEGTSTNLDILSNGFKLRTTDTGNNGSGNTIIFAAFAEVPSKYALAR